MNNDKRFMKLALSLAKRGNRVFPNPKVGSVVVKNGRVVGKGFHQFYGGPHAEIEALKRAGRQSNGATLYVTLEPCSHVGKTPPCTRTIVKSGVQRVVSAMEDPNPQVRGKGFQILRKHSIRVSEGVLAGEARRINSAYFERQKRGRKKVTIKFAMSADGKIASRTGDSKWISSRSSRRYVHKVRSAVDGIIVGANTAIADDPLLTAHGEGNNPVRVVLDPHLRVPLRKRVYDGQSPTIVFHCVSGNQRKLLSLRKRGVLAVRLKRKHGVLDFREIVAKLNDFSVNNILVEGGGETIASALDAGVVTDVLIFIAPKFIGGRSAITPIEGRGIESVRDALRLTNTRTERYGGDFILTAKTVPHRKWGGR